MLQQEIADWRERAGRLERDLQTLEANSKETRRQYESVAEERDRLEVREGALCTRRAAASRMWVVFVNSRSFPNF